MIQDIAPHKLNNQYDPLAVHLPTCFLWTMTGFSCSERETPSRKGMLLRMYGRCGVHLAFPGKSFSPSLRENTCRTGIGIPISVVAAVRL